MQTYVLQRVFQAVFVLWGAYTITYAILYLLPSDQLGLMLAASNVDIHSLTPQQLDEARVYYGLDRGPIEQYLYLMGQLLQGNLGNSLSMNQPVADLLAARFAETLKLAILAVTLSILGGGGFAYLVTLLHWQAMRDFLGRMPAVGLSVPVFWTGLLLIQIFSFTLGWFPPMGNNGWKSLILPAVTLAIPSAAIYAQVLLRGFADSWHEPYIVTARAKGLSRSAIQWRHITRNAALPVLTLIGLQIGHTVSGTVLVETVFNRTGLGRLAQEAVLRQDVPVVLSLVAVSAAFFVLINLIVDLLYPLLDPRITNTPRVT